MENLEKILSEHPFFRDLDEDSLNLIVGCASNVRFEKDDMIIREGDKANKFYIIREGSVALEIQGPGKGKITIDTLSDGEILGWSWLFPPYHWRFDGRAQDRVRAIGLDGKCLREKCEENHDLGYELLKRFSQIIDQRLQATRLQLLDIYGIPT
ncbi:MAG: cyclic nucleotide-binding domain-containing protein [Bacteroidetes bacterium]|jgi:CRP-like cAMP-binding protein|nr:cyclic nucleotide-binding domain-containing protein [Bacteroidota bacterium]